MKEKFARYYQWLSALVIGIYFVSLALRYFPPTDMLAQITAAQSGALAARILFYCCIAVLIYCFVKILFLRKSVPGFVLMCDSILIVFIAANIFLAMFTYSKSEEGCYIVSENIVVPDKISGYRYISGEHRQVYVFRNEKIFDTKFRANNLGYTSQINYVKQKTKKGKRWMVLGDSFTSSNFNSSNWVDMINAKDSAAGNELYSFSMEGIGALTWHSIFF